jgi:peptidoglycan/LPS O-acetylase OafA/YrhL
MSSQADVVTVRVKPLPSYAPHRFEILDGMRGIAAIVVMLQHNYVSLHLRCFRNSFVAVDFFFMLSGFVICHAYMNKLRHGMPAGHFIARRVGRLYPIMAATLVLGSPLLYAQAVSKHDFVVTLITNLAMLPNLTTRHAEVDVAMFPSDPALWSISFEMLASLSFPLLIQLNQNGLQTICLGAVLVLAVSSLIRGFDNYQLFFQMDAGWTVDTFWGGFPRIMFAFPCGMLLYRLRTAVTTTNFPSQLANPWLLYMALLATLTFPLYIMGAYAIFAVAIISPLLIWIGSASSSPNGFTSSVSRFLGWLSYPLYCVHMSVFYGMKYFEGRSGLLSRVPIPESVTAVTGALILAIVLGLLVDQLQLQRRLTNILQLGIAYVAAWRPLISG